MSAELAGHIPGLSYFLARTYVNRAWMDVQRRFIWSFLWGDAAIPTPVPITAGTVTTTLGSDIVVADATAIAALSAIPVTTPIGTLQFRVGQGTIYNINSFDAVTGKITLSKPYVDMLAGAGIGYTVQGNYYNAPTPDFLWWESIRDPVSGYQLKTMLTREFVDREDPQRFQSGWPVGFIPYMVNPQAGNFQNYPMFEIWPAPMNGYTYVGSYFRGGMPFVNSSDTVAAPLGEDIVMARAKHYGYQWAMANQKNNEVVVKNTAFGYLLSAVDREYEDLIDSYILKDETFSHRHLIDEAEQQFVAQLPWVSQAANLMFAP